MSISFENVATARRIPSSLSKGLEESAWQHRQPAHCRVQRAAYPSPCARLEPLAAWLDTARLGSVALTRYANSLLRCRMPSLRSAVNWSNE